MTLAIGIGGLGGSEGNGAMRASRRHQMRQAARQAVRWISAGSRCVLANPVTEC